MRPIGIIAEYNPVHNGHAYQLAQARRKFGADYLVVVMSGDFVQRGEPAVFDKYTRTAMALNCGADLVLELPVESASASAEDFASCGAALLDRLGVVDALCFGSELGETEPLEEIARILCEEPESFRAAMKESLKQGLSYPASRAMAVSSQLGPSAAELLSHPNNVLAVEYLKAIRKRGSSLRSLTILRRGQGYHDSSMPENGVHASASALRQHILDISLRKDSPSDGLPLSEFILQQPFIRHQIPKPALDVLLQEQALTTPVFADDLSLLLQYRLLTAMQNGEDLRRYADFSQEMSARLMRTALTPASFTERIEQLKTRQYTYTRISRALLHLILGITGEQIEEARRSDYVSFARILGFRKQAAPLLGAIRRHSDLPLITKTADARQILTPAALKQLNRSIYASHLYQSLVSQKGRQMKNEYTKSVIICD